MYETRNSSRKKEAIAMALTDPLAILVMTLLALVVVIALSVKVSVPLTYLVFWFSVVPVSSSAYIDAISIGTEYGAAFIQ